MVKSTQIVTMKKLKVRMDSMGGCDKSDEKDEFWRLWELMRTKLKDLLLDELAMLAMSKKDMVLFVSYCSTYRPNEPHVILGRIGRLSELSNTRIALMKMLRDWDMAGVERIDIKDDTVKVTYEDGFRPFINRVVYFDRNMKIVEYKN